LTLGDLWLSVSPRIGIAERTGDDATAEDLLQLAEAALDHAKRTNSGFAFHDGGGVEPS
jgi:GGDEF domain-containing protein